MSDQTDPNVAGSTGAGGGTGNGAEDPLTKLQAELQRVGAEEHGKGKTAGKRELLEEFGFKNKEEAKAAITAWRAAGTNATELEQKYQNALAAQAAAEAESKRWQLTSEVSGALVGAGVRGERAEPAMRLVLDAITREPEVPGKERVAAIVTSFKEQMPEFFGASTPGQDPSFTPAVPGPAGLNGSTAPNGSRGGTDPAALGDARFEAMFGKQLKAGANTSST